MEKEKDRPKAYETGRFADEERGAAEGEGGGLS